MLVTRLTAEKFYNDYNSIKEKFSYDGAMALYEYIEEYASSSEEKNFLINPNDWALEWTEYTTKEEAVSDLGYSSWDELDEQHGTYEFDGGILVYDY